MRGSAGGAVSPLVGIDGWQVLWYAIAVAGASALLGLAAAKFLRWLLRRAGMTDPPLPPHRSPTVLVVVTAALIAYDRALGRDWADQAATLLGSVLIAGIAWFFVDLVTVAEVAILARYPEDLADLRARHIRTQVTLLRRIAVALIVTIALAAILWGFPVLRQLGLSLFASAGVLGIIAGLAAQTTLGNVFAGTQIAFTDALRVGDVIVIGEDWGHVESITLTYVAVRIWDGTTLILPCTYFTTTPFKNWTHAGATVIGQIDLTVSWDTDVRALRAELERVATTCPLWDGTVASLVVESTSGTALELLCFVSARRSDDVAELTRQVREDLVGYMQTHTDTIPVPRVGLDPRNTSAKAGSQ